MLTFYAPGERGAVMDDMASCPELTRDAVWIDVFSPTPDEEQELEAALGTGIPTREEMQAIELSSRLYEENGILFLTATVLSKSASTQPESSAITFILTNQKLVTLRYADPAPFAAFRARRDANVHRYTTGYQVLGGLIDAVVERAADILEGAAANLDQLSSRVFDRPVATSIRASHNPLGRTPRGSARRARQRDFVEILTLIGSSSDLVSRVRESIVSWVRLMTFFREMRKEEPAARETIVHSKAVLADLSSLSDHASFLSSKIGFLLDATLGMINNEQNAIIKILSVAALVFLPPTLVAGIYGMNFDFMPELKWAQGYPFALGLMLIAAVLPYLLFRRKGWL